MRVRNSGTRDIRCTLSFSNGGSFAISRIPPGAAAGLTLDAGVTVAVWECG